MACLAPLQGYRSGSGGFTASSSKSPSGVPMTISCGHCIQCRIRRSAEWALRISHEASEYSENTFLTLTYAPEHFPSDGSISIRAVQLFMKRLRKFICPRRVRFFAVGEYGELFGRPHYHVLLFGYSFPDRVPSRRTRFGRAWRSASLEALWPFGRCELGSLSWHSASYVARYCIKKITGPLAEAHYGGLLPEFQLSSSRPGIGEAWASRNLDALFAAGGVELKGRMLPIPKYYRQLLSDAQRRSLSLSARTSSSLKLGRGGCVRVADFPGPSSDDDVSLSPPPVLPFPGAPVPS